MEAIDIDEIQRLSVDERICLIELIWDTVEADLAPAELTDAQRSEVARRIADHERDPSTAIPAEQVFRELRERFG